MIEVLLNKPEFEYDIHSLIKAFFPEQYVGVSAEKKEYDEKIDIRMQVNYGEDTIQITWQEIVHANEDAQANEKPGQEEVKEIPGETIQVDYNLPERFQLEYMGSDNQKHRPVMIHRAPFGSMERFVAVLIEHTAGKFPLWLTPDQVAILPISEKFNEYAEQVKAELRKFDVRAIVDDRNEKIGRKIRDNEMKRIPYMLIVGEKEAENGEVAVRKQGEGDKGTMKIEEFGKNLAEEVSNMINKW